MKPNAFAPNNSGAFSVKALLLLCVVCLSFFAGVVRADDDLSPADKVQAERLQNQIDAESKAAKAKADRDWYKLNHPGDNSSSLIIPAGIVLLVVGVIIFSKNKTAGKIYAGVCVAMAVFVAILALTENPPPPVLQPEPPRPSPEAHSDTTATAVKSGILQAQLVAQAKKQLEQSLMLPTASRKIKDVQLVPIDTKNFKGTAIIEITATNSGDSATTSVDFSLTSQDEHTFDMHIAGLSGATKP